MVETAEDAPRRSRGERVAGTETVEDIHREPGDVDRVTVRREQSGAIRSVLDEDEPRAESEGLRGRRSSRPKLLVASDQDVGGTGGAHDLGPVLRRVGPV